MSTFAQTTDGDLALTLGSLTLVTDVAEEAAIELQNKLKFARGEYFLDTREGIPFFEKVFVKSPDLLALRELYRNVILSVPGIKSVAELTVDFDDSQRKASIAFRAVADNGRIIVGGTGQPFIVEP